MATYDNVYFTNGSDVVFVATQQVEENIINAVSVITAPTTEDTPNTSLILNLNRVEKRFTITGDLTYGKLSGAETKTSAKDKRDLLKTISEKGSVVVLTYEENDYDVAIEKINFRYKAKDNTDSVDGEIVYETIITCVVGGDMI